MRHPRLSLVGSAPAEPPLVAVAHGSKDPRAAATVGELLAVVRERLGSGGPEVRAAFLDHCAPSLPQALAALAPDEHAPYPGAPVRCITVPLLLTSAYHRKADIPAQLAAATSALPRLDVECTVTLGPHPLLLTGLERRLREAGVAVDDSRTRAGTSVVLAAAGSSDPAANRAVAALAAHWAKQRGWRAVVPAYASAAGPRPAAAVAALRDASGGPVAVASYLLAPGYFADKIRSAALAAGASAVSGVLGAAPEVAAVVMERYRAAVSTEANRREPVLASRFLLLSDKPAATARGSHSTAYRFLLLSEDSHGGASTRRTASCCYQAITLPRLTPPSRFLLLSEEPPRRAPTAYRFLLLSEQRVCCLPVMGEMSLSRRGPFHDRVRKTGYSRFFLHDRIFLQVNRRWVR